MFEKEIKFIADFSLNKIKNLGSFFTYEKLAAAEIHPAILKYISAELDFLIYEDRKKLLQQSLFDYSSPEISKLFRKINEEIKKTRRISYEDVKKLILQAVSFNLNFVSRPKWSLTRLVYDTSDNKPVDEIKLMFSYLYYYEYLGNIFQTYLNKRKVLSLSLIEFELILNKIDKEIFIPGESGKIIEGSLLSMADFFSIGHAGKTRIPAAPVEIFLKEKNLIDYLFRLRRALPSDNRGLFEIEEIKNVIFSNVPLDQQPSLSVSEPDIEPETEEEELQPEPEPLRPPREIKHDDVYSDEDRLRRIREELLSSDEESIPEEGVPEIEEIDEVPETSELHDDELIIEAPDEDFLKLYDEELKEFEKDAEEVSTDTDEVKFGLSEKEKLVDLYDFEDEHEKPGEPESEEKQEEVFELDDNISSELESSPEYDLSDTHDDYLDEGYKKLEIPASDDELDLELEAEEDAEKKADYEFRKDEDEEPAEKPSFVTVPEEKKKPEKKDFTHDLFSYLSDREIEKIIMKVFNEDREDFTFTMERISECNTYEEATEILKSVFFTYRVNPYTRDAVILTNAVSNYFNQA